METKDKEPTKPNQTKPNPPSQTDPTPILAYHPYVHTQIYRNTKPASVAALREINIYRCVEAKPSQAKPSQAKEAWLKAFVVHFLQNRIYTSFLPSFFLPLSQLPFLANQTSIINNRTM